MKLLLDTHAVLWWLLDDPQLPHAVRDVIRNPSNAVLVSAVSAWELATKHRLGKLPEAESVVRDFSRLLLASKMQKLPISVEHALLAGRLPGPHRDPFDRMLIAQSRIENVPVATRNPAFAAYGVDVRWA